MSLSKVAAATKEPASKPLVGSARRGATLLGPRSASRLQGGGVEAMEATSKARWSRQVDKQTLGAHYSYVVGELGAAAAPVDEERRQHDLQLAQDELAHASSSKTGFTDRSRRLREGQGAREALRPRDAGVEEEEAEDTGCAAACGPAGQPSHLVFYNRAPPCGKDDFAGRARGPAEGGELLEGQKVTDVLGQALDAMDQLPAKQEEAFAAAMGRKARGWKVMTHRGDASDAGIAGEYQRDRRARDVSATGDCKRRPASQGRLGGSSPRSGVAMTLAPNEGDAAVVDKVVPSKARTVFTELASAEAARHVVEQNQENFRFAFAPARRSSSVPQPKGQVGAGLTSTSNARRLHREVSTPRKPSVRSTDAGHVARALDREGGRHEVKAERSHRMQHEKAFAEICSFTKQSKQAMRKTSATIRSTFGTGQSSAMASLLAQE